MRCLHFALIGVFALAAGAALGAAPQISAPEDAHITHERAVDLDDYALPVGSFAAPSAVADLSGKVVRRAWRLPAAKHSVAGVIDSYRLKLEGQGYWRLLDCKGAACGGFDFRFGAELLPPPAMTMDVRDFAQLTVGRAGGQSGPAGYGSILVSRVRDRIYVQVVTVVPKDGGLALVGTPLERLPEAVLQERSDPSDASEGGSDGVAKGASDESSRDIEDKAAASGTDGGAEDTADNTASAENGTVGQDTASAGTAGSGEGRTAADDVPADGRPLLDRLLQYGHVPVAGLTFASGGSKLTEGSGAALDQMAKMLAANPDLKVAIVGHSDNRGSLNVNIELSRRRAAAVRSALIKRGVKANRLEARGVGYLAPRRSNATDAGRALNRRVELVLR